ncbi:MAG: hypothetical protein KJ600_02575 [Nanoarchaeota archaeon]|nr:hypothetical protein [Nanoarchaeota archaeon]
MIVECEVCNKKMQKASVVYGVEGMFIFALQDVLENGLGKKWGREGVGGK